jgi:hypothetical protein
MFKLCTVAVLGVTLFGGAAHAVLNLEYGQEYEVAYLQTCEQDHPSRACTCSMLALEEKVGFVRFAEEVDQYRETVLAEGPLAPLANGLLALCEARLHASE